MLQLKNLPNILTFLRVVIIPVLIGSFYIKDLALSAKVSTILFLLASITDFLDGFIARKYGFESKLGNVLDPIADKILVGSVLIMLVKLNLANEIPCIVILSREIMIAGIREFAAYNNLRIEVSSASKFKTALQMVAISTILLGRAGVSSTLLHVGEICLWISAVLSVTTSLGHFRELTKVL